MFTERVVFILGAGSNLEHGFLLGTQLKDQITHRIRSVAQSDGLSMTLPDFLRHVYASQAWQQEKLDQGQAIEAAAKIARGLGGKDSIDEFLDAHADDRAVNTLGKFAIVDTILAAERDSRLALGERDSDAGEIPLKTGAYLHLWKNLTRNLKATDIDILRDRTKTPLKVITFNYDRSLEQFLFCALAQTYHLDVARAAEIVRALDIVHVYGAVGDWGFGLQDPAATSIPYGFRNLFAPFKFDGPLIRHLARKISTYTEQVDTATVREIKASVMLADQIYFVGMGYHEQNMQLLMPEANLKATVVAGTAVKESPRKCAIVSEQLRQKCNFLHEGIEVVSVSACVIICLLILVRTCRRTNSSAFWTRKRLGRRAEIKMR